MTGPGRPRLIAARARVPRATEPGQLDSPATAPTPAAGSDLAAQNDLFSAAVAARRAGQTGRALDLYQQLVDRFPESSLVEGALAARMRLLAERRDGRAAPAAAAYLAHFPDGFARTEARALLQPPSPEP